MARAIRAVVQVERLSDQVYQLLRDDLKTGEFPPGRRLLEVELAERYRVSRTPIREALFQLSREGLLTDSERGYVTPTYTRADVMHRLEVKRLLDPRVAEHVAQEADVGQIKQLSKVLAAEKSAHAAGKVKTFVKANQDFRALYRSICRNDLLARCLTMVDDQFEAVRATILESADNREATIAHDERMVEAVSRHDVEAAVAETFAFLDLLQAYYDASRPVDADQASVA